jgi:hypothetical protein
VELRQKLKVKVQKRSKKKNPSNATAQMASSKTPPDATIVKVTRTALQLSSSSI